MLQWPETQNWEDLETAENRIQAKDLSSEFEFLRSSHAFLFQET